MLENVGTEVRATSSTLLRLQQCMLAGGIIHYGCLHFKCNDDNICARLAKTLEQTLAIEFSFGVYQSHMGAGNGQA